MADVAVIGEFLVGRLGENSYVGYLFQHIHELGILVDEHAFAFGRPSRSEEPDGALTLRICDVSEIEPDFWVEFPFESVQEAAEKGTEIAMLQVRTGVEGLEASPLAEPLILRCFENPPYPPSDREELLYPTLFGMEPPRLLWSSKTTPLRVLRIREPARSNDIYVTCGLSDPLVWEPASIYNDQVSGAGYELILRSSSEAVGNEFLGWANYIAENKTHLLPGEWLEYNEGDLIPGTDIAGFLIGVPNDVPAPFPVGSGEAYWHALYPVTKEQLARAKETDVYEVIASLGEH